MRFLSGLVLAVVCIATTPARAQTALLAVAEVSLAVDAATTLDIKNHANAWEWHTHETNPLLGPHPGDVKVVGYFALVMGGTAVGYHLLPAEVRPYAMLAIIGLEAYCIRKNFKNGLSMTLPF